MDFDNGQINITRSVVYGVISRCKTESSSKPVPMCLQLSEMLKKTKKETEFSAPDDWVFASSRARGKRPLWGHTLMRKQVHPVAKELGLRSG